MNRYISFAQMFWKATIFCLKLVFKGIFLIMLFPIKLAHRSVKSGVEVAFKDTKLNIKQLETIEKAFEYSAYYVWGQNLFAGSSFKTWYTQILINFPNLLPHMTTISIVIGGIFRLIAFNMKGKWL